MSLFVIDVEADGPCPGLYSMVCFGAVQLTNLSNTFHGRTAPISDNWQPDALAISGFTREQHLGFSLPVKTIRDFAVWLATSNQKGRPIFVSDNVAFDWQFINYYFHAFIGHNPFGYSGRRIGDIYAGLKKDIMRTTDWKKLRKTEHTHNPVDDARGNAEALLEFRKLGLSFCSRLEKKLANS